MASATSDSRFSCATCDEDWSQGAESSQSAGQKEALRAEEAEVGEVQENSSRWSSKAFFLYTVVVKTLKNTAAVLFYILGVTAIIGIVLINNNIASEDVMTLLNIMDLPLILSAMLYGGSSLVLSLGGAQVSRLLAGIVFGVLGIMFLVFAYLNFAFPFQVTF